MAKLLSVFVIFAGLFWSQIYANTIITGPGDNNVIDLSSYGARLFGVPSKTSGERVAKWNVFMNTNPDEMGDYLEGDILHPPPVKKASGPVSLTSRWPNATVPYFISGSFTPSELILIQSAMADFHNLTCVRFVPRTNETDYIEITSFGSGCWSSVGRIGGAQRINLQNPECVTMKGVPIHEFLHALGFIHEHTRPDRCQYVQIQWPNLEPLAMFNFIEIPGTLVSDFGELYDYGSVMHYSSDAFSSNGRPTIVPTQGCVTIGQRIGMSPADVRSVKTMYNCP